MCYFLCYHPENDTLSVEITRKGHVLFTSYEDKGEAASKPAFMVPRSDFKVHIKTNFDFGKASYFKVYIHIGEALQINISDVVSYYCYRPANPCTARFNPETKTESWLEAFELICDVYNNQDVWQENELLNNLEELETLLLEKTDNFMFSPWNKKLLSPSEDVVIEYKSHIFKYILDCAKDNGLNRIEFISTALMKIAMKLFPLFVKSYKQSKSQDLLKSIDTIYMFFKEEYCLNMLVQTL